MLQSWITRDDLHANRDAIYIFGDNVAREGVRGLAREMRHEPNAHPISVSWEPFRPFTHATAPAAIEIITKEFNALIATQPRIVVLPLNGIVPEFVDMPDPIRQHLKFCIKRYLRISVTV